MVKKYYVGVFSMLIFAHIIYCILPDNVGFKYLLILDFFLKYDFKIKFSHP
jgi:hypothetical protein